MSKSTRREVIRTGLAAGLGAVAAPYVARGQAAYPGSQTVKFIVPYPPAGATDIVGRAVGDILAAHWKTTTIVDNVPGAGGNIGMDRVSKGVADGTQILIVPPNITTNQFLYKSMPFNAEADIIPVSQVAGLANLLCVRKGLPVKNVAELIAYAKAHPGKLNFASSGVGTTIHLSAEMFRKMAGIDIVHVAYRGSAPAVNDMIAGHVDLMFDNLPSIEPQARAGNVIGLAVTSKEKSSFAPSYPTVGETIPGFDVTSWFGIGLPAKTPQAIIDKLEADIIAVSKPGGDLAKRLAGQSIDVVGSTRKDFTAFVTAERKRWGDLITELKIKVE
jgi:tripartite-type tricarboxylate transporter receptor subunit TctC